tara:strand:+ start:59 stop:1255 length:1197 start_codon:yes stop_codon:yes gene_type:complete
MISIYPRKILDFTYRNIFYGLFLSLFSYADRKKTMQTIRNIWPDKYVNIGLSVRTIFDSLLSVKNFPPGSEILMTGITIPDMVKIVEAHGLIVVPIDINMTELQVKEDEISSAITENTVMIVVAHLFGSKMDMSSIHSALGDRKDIMVVEDCAQAFEGIDGYTKHPDTDVSMFSFGSIKSVTALGCAVGFHHDNDLCKKVSDSNSDYSSLTNFQFFNRLIKYLMLKVLTEPFIYGIFIRGCILLGFDYDSIVISAVRNFRKTSFLDAIRKQPSKAQLNYLLYRLTTIKPDHFLKRKKVGDQVIFDMKNKNSHGVDNATHTYWLFPIRSENRESLVKSLIKNGFDATFTSTQLIPINKTGNNQSEPLDCKNFMNNTIYLPVYEQLPEKKVKTLVSIINE